MSVITFIGNNATERIITDGGRIKMRLFMDILKREGNSVDVIELDGWKKRFISIVFQIRKSVKRGDTIVIMAGPKGCRLIIPIVCHFNKKHQSRMIFCPVGIGTFDHLVKKLTPDQIVNFINCNDFYGIEDKKMKQLLHKMDFVCPENETQNVLYKTYYGLENTCVIENFRDIEIKPRENDFSNNVFKMIYASRVKEYKGILDLMDIVNNINNSSEKKIFLDIYGDNQLSKENIPIFENMLNNHVRYFGALPSSEINEKIKEYDLFCLPTSYYGEGTSGALIEAMVAGTPVLVSSYSQVNAIIKNNENGYIFRLGSKSDLQAKLMHIINNKNELKRIAHTAQNSAEKYTYFYNRDTFLKVMMGDAK